MKLYLLTPALLGLALAMTGAVAQYEDPDFEAEPATPAFETLDVDGDGYVSRDEAGALPCLAENFDQVELSSEEGLSRSEFDNAVQSYCASW